MTTPASIPLFDFQRTIPATATIGDKVLPIKVKRFTRAEWEALEQKWDFYIQPRGVVERTEEEAKAHQAEQLAFFEATIVECITLDEGLVRNGDAWVTDGAGLIDVFHARKDVLGLLLGAVYIQNKLPGIVIKNSSSPRSSGPGSDLSTQDRGGDAPDSIAASAESSSTAENEAATERRGELAPASAEDLAVPV